MAMVTCKKCGHKMSDNWANMANQCPNCKTEIYTSENQGIAFKMKTCDTCNFGIEMGGDIVPYGSTTAQLPISYECDCPNVPEAIYDDYDKSSELANSGKCEYWEPKNKGENIMEFTISEEEIKETMENQIPLITYKGKIHIHAYAYNTACNLDIPMQGKHLNSRRLGDIENVTCADCLNSLKQG